VPWPRFQDDVYIKRRLALEMLKEKWGPSE